MALALTSGYAYVAAAGSSPTLGDTARTLFCYFRVTDVTLTRAIMSLSAFTSGNERTVSFMTVGSNLISRFMNGGTNDTTIAAISNNTWYRCLMTQDGTGLGGANGYMNSATPVALTQLSNPTVMDRLGAGQTFFNNTTIYTSPSGMDLAYLYSWSSVLSGSDITALMVTQSNPSGISTGTRLQGYSCISNGNEIGGGTALTTSGTTAFNATDPLPAAPTGSLLIRPRGMGGGIQGLSGGMNS